MHLYKLQQMQRALHPPQQHHSTLVWSHADYLQVRTPYPASVSLPTVAVSCICGRHPLLLGPPGSCCPRRRASGSYCPVACLPIADCQSLQLLPILALAISPSWQ